MQKSDFTEHDKCQVCVDVASPAFYSRRVGGGGEGYSYTWAKRTTSYLKDSLYENVNMVDKKGYDNCNATGGLVFYPAMIQWDTFITGLYFNLIRLIQMIQSLRKGLILILYK